MASLRRDVRGNTMAIMAAAIIPLAGMVGGGVDIARLYIVKTRLQHACDAGALAGRKSMGGGTWNQTANGTANYPNSVAEKFFDSNYQSDAYGATNRTRTFTEAAGKVTGTATAVLPMTLMKIFGRDSETLTVTCDAEMRLPNTDVMFVLDTTGSMACRPSDASQPYCNSNIPFAESRIAGLRIAVKCFYQIVARLDVADTDCEGSEPSGGTGDQVQIRFGFVPYATNVNVGKLLPTEYFSDSAPYQTRKVNHITYTYPNAGTPSNTGTTTGSYVTGAWEDKATSVNASASNKCAGLLPADTSPTAGSQGSAYNVVTTPGPGTGVQTVTYKRDTVWTKYHYQYDSYTTSGTDRCLYDRQPSTMTQTDSYTRQDVGVPQVYWDYGQYNVNISGLKSGTSWNNSFVAQVADNGGDSTITWDGCIEERQTTQTTNFSPIPAAAKDLDIDLIPNSDATRWKPALPRLIFTRRTTSGANYNATDWAGTNTGSWNTAEQTNVTNDYTNGSSYSCPTEARRLQSWTDPATFSTYVNSLTPDGATYHDIGLLWGARLMSATGIFSSDNAFTPQGGEIERHLIFMTDGDTNANDYDYAAYGLPYFDHRQTGASPTKDQLDDQVNARFLALCTAVKNKNITLWVISFGASTSVENQTRLSQCASSGRYFTAADSAALQVTFKSIADQISQLRLTK